MIVCEGVTLSPRYRDFKKKIRHKRIKLVNTDQPSKDFDP